jgi:hypothetical protein
MNEQPKPKMRYIWPGIGRLILMIIGARIITALVFLVLAIGAENMGGIPETWVNVQVIKALMWVLFFVSLWRLWPRVEVK